MVILLSLLQNCSKENKTVQEEFSYMATMSAPKEYPVEVHIGVLTDDKKELICGVPKAGVTTGSWQYDGVEAGQGGNKIPSHLDLTYVSYAEKKFWRVNADVPKEKILQLFREGFMVEGNPDSNGEIPWEEGTYDEITIGAAPGGVIVIWLSGNHHRREVCRLQAKEISVNKDEFMRRVDPKETQEQFYELSYKILVPDSIKTAIAQNGIPFGLWDKYREKYSYRFVLAPYDNKDKITGLYRINYNGESEILMDAKSVATYKPDSIPYDINFDFTKYNAEIIFNDEEMLRVFGELKKSYPDQPIDIVLVPGFMYNDFKVVVQCKDKKIALEKFKVKRVWGG
ncbi:uncharacterized protein CHSO_2745 [Chryseobacterium sp. StRB126]|uniref:DUF2931 family protein n=1 Tax=Chryseobacterium sp. StRB126 TaxID=878220 RepID=UPI0004E99373|nr:DUF2931 family protein [Chryseobacterium sp. StRB126]BAP31782.1 uncharacterized protein CHSO_2745 [Chryseobacterium sp. StRB126]